MLHPRTHRLAAATTAAILALTTALTAAPAAATPTPAATRARLMNAYLAEHPGGVPLNDNDISYSNGTFIVTLTAPAHTYATALCPAGWFCFYDRPYFGFPRGKLSACGWQNLATWGWQNKVDSAYYNIYRDAVAFYENNGRWLFQISAASRSIPDTYPNHNKADKVFRHCR